MPQLSPFVGLRPQPGTTGPLDDVICPPYDVINDRQREALARRSPYNVVRVELPDGDYEGAARTLGRWQAEGAFADDPAPALYGYRMTYEPPGGGRRSTLGVIGALQLEPPGRGVLPHEQTTPKAKTDRLELLSATRANTSPIWCLCPEPGLSAAIGTAPTAGLATARSDDGTLHEIWPIDEPHRALEVSRVVGASPLLIADGHHRYETALTYQSGQPPGDGADAVLALVVELSDEQLSVRAIHRVVYGLPAGVVGAGAHRECFDLVPVSPGPGEGLLEEMLGAGALGLWSRQGAWMAVPRPGAAADGFELDSSRADAALATLPPHELRYEHDVSQALAELNAGEVDAAVFCRPATVAQIARTARGGERMPPKTTFFWPKPATGLVLRQLG